MKRARHGEQPRIPLFTFLDVLICTMGALIVLLSLLIARAKAHAVDKSAAESAAAATTPAASPTAQIDPEELKQLTEQQEDLQWRADMLKEQREQYAQDLANKRLELAHLEDHIRRLEDQAKKLMVQAEEFKRLNSNKLADRDSAQQQLDEMEREIATKKSELDKARKEALRRRPAYAIVPYDGPNGTSRRPMYIECTEAGIVLQPEGVKLSAEDFQGPQGPGNPLDAALRAIREHWKRNGLQGEPYPLIIVRPDGAVAFGACRSAMKHWESEFGYELVDQDSELKFPPVDRQLAETLERAIADARKRQFALVAAMPNRFGSEARLTSFRAADNIDPSEYGDQSGGGQGAGPGGRSGRGVPSFGRGGSGMGTGPTGATGTGGSGTSGMANSMGGPTANGSRSPVGKMPATGGAGGTGPAGAPGDPSGSGTGNSNSSQVANGSTSGRPGSATTGGSATGKTGSTGGSATQGGPTQGGASSASGGVAGGTASQGMTSGSAGGTSASTQSSNAASGGQGNGSSVGSASNASLQSGTPSPMVDTSPQMAKARKALKNRGKDWGLPNSSGKATAVSRPIRMECHENQLLLLPEQGEGRTPLIVPVEDDLTQNLDAVIAAVWQRMDRWGLAVLGGYWKPILVVDVKPGGEERFWELQQLLRGSGIEVEQKP